MITKMDLEHVVGQINGILKSLEARLSEIEKNFEKSEVKRGRPAKDKND